MELKVEEMARIVEWTTKLATKNDTERDKLIFEWAKTGKITMREHTLLCRWHFGRGQ